MRRILQREQREVVKTRGAPIQYEAATVQA
jgi:hypothetical protein